VVDHVLPEDVEPVPPGGLVEEGRPPVHQPPVTGPHQQAHQQEGLHKPQAPQHRVQQLAGQQGGQVEAQPPGQQEEKGVVKQPGGRQQVQQEHGEQGGAHHGRGLEDASQHAAHRGEEGDEGAAARGGLGAALAAGQRLVHPLVG